VSTPINSNEENNTTEDTNDKKATVLSENLPKQIPYEAALLKAFDKLTSQILIFLLAYVILLIGIGVLAVEISDTFKNLLYIIPILGVGAYLWSQRRDIHNDAKKSGINVKSGWVSDEAKVTGVRTTPDAAQVPHDVDVSAAVVKDKAEVTGFVVESDDVSEKQSSDLEYMKDIFQQLSISNRRKLITDAQRLMDKQSDSD
jgi:hypothetical protein